MSGIDQIRELRRDAETYWRALHEAMHADYVEVDQGPGVTLTVNDEPVTTLNPHTAWVKVSAACNHLIDANLDIRVDSGAPGKAAREQGERVAAALRTLHYHLTSDAKSDPHRGALFSAATMGMGVWFVGTDFSRLLALDARKPPSRAGEADRDYDARDDVAAWKDERARTLPLFLEHVDPRTVFPDPGTHGDRYVFQIGKRTVGDLRRTWVGWEPQLRRGKRKSDFDEVEWLELWSAPGGLDRNDPGSYYYEADGIPIRRFGTAADSGEEEDLGAGPWDHKLGFCPYVVWNAGYGMPYGAPRSQYKGIVRNAREGGLFRAKAEKRSQFHALSRAAAWHAWVVPEGYDQNFEIGIGAVNTMPTDQNGRLVVPQPVVGPPLPQVLFSEAAALEADINAETVSDVLSAPGEAGTDVALLYARMVQEAAMALGPLRRNAERAYDQVWARIAGILSNPELFGEEDRFQVVGVDRKGNPVEASLSRRLFTGHHIFTTTIDPRFASDQIGRTQSGLAQVAAGVIDRVTHHREYSGLDNPEQLVNKADADAVRRRLIAQGFFDRFATAWATGQLPRDVKGRDFLQLQQQADIAAATAPPTPPPPAPGGQGPNLAPSARQALSAAGGAMVRPGSPLVDAGASDALSEQLPGRGQEGF